MMLNLAPGFLVATPTLSCPFFHHTIVLLVEHTEEGALGFVINRPTSTRLSGLLDTLGIEPQSGLRDDGEVLVGGPVAPDTGWVLFDPTSGDSGSADSILLSEHLAVSASRSLLESMAQGSGPARRSVLLGYAGWGPGQLDGEIQEGAWVPVDLDDALVYDLPYEERWSAGLSALGIDPARMIGLIADA